MVLVVVVSLELPLRQADCIVLVVVANQVLVMRVACGVFDTGVSHRLDGIRISQRLITSVVLLFTNYVLPVVYQVPDVACTVVTGKDVTNSVLLTTKSTTQLPKM